jgi:hypothetical protein
MILVVWKYAQMHQNTFLTISDLTKYSFQAMILVIWKYAHTYSRLLTTDYRLQTKDYRLTDHQSYVLKKRYCFNVCTG